MKLDQWMWRHTLKLILGWISAVMLIVIAQEQQAKSEERKQGPKQEFPPYQEVFEDYTEVITTIDRVRPLMSLWVRQKDNQALAAFPPDFEKRKWFIAFTVSSGEIFAGLQEGEFYGYWRRIGNRMAFIIKNLDYRSTGDPESKASVERIFTDKVLVDAPILTILTNWGPVIDLDALLVGQAEAFFGKERLVNAKKHLAVIKKAKAFPHNIEIAFEIPMQDGTLKTFHYSISEILDNPAYKPRLADQRVGYFTTTFVDLGKYQGDDNKVRYINRWYLEKADPSLKISPVKKPIVFYIEHTTPVRYRRWVREGVLMWNRAFERIGFANAIEVYYQDATTGAHMEKDPEDVRYNFIRWLNNDVGTAIGPSRVNPETGEILDADVIITDGWIRYFWRQYNDLMPEFIMEGLGPETLAWLQKYPQFDPRVLLAPPEERDQLINKIKQGVIPEQWKQWPSWIMFNTHHHGNNNFSRMLQSYCLAPAYLSIDLGLMAMHLELFNEGLIEQEDRADEDSKSSTDHPLIDGIPEWFIGPLVAELVAHEVGHTLGLRHNFKASSIYDLFEINSPEFKGKKAIAGSVMDYLPINIFKLRPDEFQGDFTMIDLGPYDYWAIEYGYSQVNNETDLKKILSKATLPELAFATDEDTVGPDPLARTYDLSKNPIDYARRQMELAQYHRNRLIEKFVKEGQSWARARYGYELTLRLQIRALGIMVNWLGGSFVHRDKKGDPNARPPFQPVPSQKQREALEFVIENAFDDKAFGLTPQMIQYFGIDKWLDEPNAFRDGRWPVHDRIMGIQASVLTGIMNPTILGRVLDNEMMASPDEEIVTVPEVFERLRCAIFKEIIEPPQGKFSMRSPMISSLRRNLQREFVERLIYLSVPGSWSSASHKPAATVALTELRTIKKFVDRALEERRGDMDSYTYAHLSELQMRIDKAIQPDYILTLGTGLYE